VSHFSVCYGHPVTVARDTTPLTAELHEQAVQRLGVAGRLRIALELSDLAHDFAVAGIRRSAPELTEEQARRELAIRLYGPMVADR
jgi:hypothetical protein